MAYSPTYPTSSAALGCDLRVSFPSGVIPFGVCVHSTSGISSHNWLCSGSAEAGQPASADFLIDRNGKQTGFVRAGRRPYHAGRSRFEHEGVIYRNDQVSAVLLGVELEQVGDQLCTWQQLDSLAQLVVASAQIYDWRWPYCIVGHYQIAQPMGRRSDPQGFNWGEFMGFLYARSRAEHIGGL